MPGVADAATLMQMALQLTPEQKERLLAARTYLLAQMMEIIQERTLIIAMLQVQPSSRNPLYGQSSWPCECRYSWQGSLCYLLT